MLTDIFNAQLTSWNSSASYHRSSIFVTKTVDIEFNWQLSVSLLYVFAKSGSFKYFRRFDHMMHALHGIHLVPADDWTLWILRMMCIHKLAQWRATLTKTKLRYFTVQYVPELCMIYGFSCVMFTILFALHAVWWFSGDCFGDWLIVWVSKAEGPSHQWWNHEDLGQASAYCSTSYEGYYLPSSQWCSPPQGPDMTDVHPKHLHHSTVGSSE